MKEIVYWYGIFTLAMIPLGIIMTVLMEKRTRMISKILDELVPSKKQNKESKDKTKKDTEKDKKEEQKKPPEEQNTEKEKILKLKTNDTYICRLNNLESKQAGREPQWTVTDNFVAEINSKSGLLTAIHEGKTYVECGQRRMFLLEVEPSDKNWILEDAYKSVIERKPMKEISSAMAAIKGMMFVFNTMQRTKKYWQIPGKDIKLCYRYADPDTPDKGKIQQALAILPKSELKNTTANLSQRMKQLQTVKKTNTSFWVHRKWYDEYEDNLVDTGAFIQIKKDSIIVGFSVLWQDGIKEEEFQMNVQLFLRSFIGMIKNFDMMENLKAQIPSERNEADKEKDNIPAKQDKQQIKDQTEEIETNNESIENYETSEDDKSWQI